MLYFHEICCRCGAEIYDHTGNEQSANTEESEKLTGGTHLTGENVPMMEVKQPFFRYQDFTFL